MGSFDFRSCDKVAVIGGAFDPIHYGHLAAAQTVYENFDVDRVVPVSYTHLSRSKRFEISERSGIPYSASKLRGGVYMYAIIETGGKQYKVSEGDVIKVEKLAVEAGTAYAFDKVLVVRCV